MAEQTKTAVVLAADGVEEIEIVTIVDVLRRGGVDTWVMGLASEAGWVAGGHGMRLGTDDGWDAEKAFAADILLVPGGMGGVENLMADARVLGVLKRRADAKKPVGAICAGPLVLDAAGVLEEGTAFTCYPGLEGRTRHPENWVDEVEVAGGTASGATVLTSQGPATAMDFALGVLGELAGVEAECDVAEPMLCYRDCVGEGCGEASE